VQNQVPQEHKGPDVPHLSSNSDVSATPLHLDLRRIHVGERRVMHLVQRRRLVLRAFLTVCVLTGTTRAVSRMPLACIALSTVRCFPSGDGPWEGATLVAPATRVAPVCRPDTPCATRHGGAAPVTLCRRGGSPVRGLRYAATSCHIRLQRQLCRLA
jgi:hypothetical protein